jgi:hypothetical protein
MNLQSIITRTNYPDSDFWRRYVVLELSNEFSMLPSACNTLQASPPPAHMTHKRSILVHAPLKSSARRQSRGFITRIFQQQCHYTMRWDLRDRYIPYRSPVIRVRPEIL